MKKEYIDTVLKEETIFNNKFLIINTYLFSFIFCLVPFLLLNEEYIVNNVEFKIFADNGAILFHAIESFSKNALINNLYYFSKFQLTWAVFSSTLSLIVCLFILGKIYLFNLGYISVSNKKRYTNVFIKEKGYHSSALFILFTIVLLDMLLFEYIMEYTSYSTSLFRSFSSNTVSIFFYSTIICSLISFFIAYLIIETLALLRLIFIKKK